MQDFFSLLHLPKRFNIDQHQLEISYRAALSASHPDRFVTASGAEKLQAMQLATLANEAYQTLQHPARRGAYLLNLAGIDVLAEKNTALPSDFLMQQMEWREEIADAEQARDISAIEKSLSTIRIAAKTLEEELSAQFSVNDLQTATTTVRKLIFIDKVCADVKQIIEKLEE